MEKKKKKLIPALLCLLCPRQVFPVPAQVRPVRPGAQGDQDRLPLHHAGQGQARGAEGAAHTQRPEAQPQRLLAELAELRGLLRKQQAQPHRTRKLLFPWQCFPFLPLPSPEEHTVGRARRAPLTVLFFIQSMHGGRKS